MKAVIGIARVSTSVQFKKGSSVQEQGKQIKAFAEKIGGELVEIVKIQASGKSMVLNTGQLAATINRAKEMRK